MPREINVQVDCCVDDDAFCTDDPLKMDSALIESDNDSIVNDNKNVLDDYQHYFTPNCNNNMSFDDDTNVISLESTEDCTFSDSDTSADSASFMEMDECFQSLSLRIQ